MAFLRICSKKAQSSWVKYKHTKILGSSAFVRESEGIIIEPAKVPKLTRF
jgi:hypothetical protein